MPILGQYLIDLTKSILIGGAVSLITLWIVIYIQLEEYGTVKKWVWITAIAIVIAMILTPSVKTAKLIAGQ